IAEQKHKEVQSAQKVREQLLLEIAKYETEISRADDDIANLQKLLTNHKNSSEGSELNVDDANRNITQLKEIKAKYEDAIGKLRTMLTANSVAASHQFLGSQLRQLRAQEAQFQRTMAEMAIRQRAEMPRDVPP